MTLSNEEKAKLNGLVVTWDVTGDDVPLTVVEAALVKAGIVAETTIRRTTAFGRAVKLVPAGSNTKKLVDKLKSPSKAPIFQLTDKITGETDVAYVHDIDVTLDLETGKAECANEFMADTINEKMDEVEGLRSTQYISGMVKRLFADKADLYAINPRKGVAYFVPQEHMDFADNIDIFLREVGGCLWTFPVPKGDAAGDKSVKDAIDTGLATLLSDLETSVGAWGEDTGTRAIASANDRWALAAAKIEAYSGYLQERQGVLKERLDNAKQDMQAKVAILGKD